MRDPRQHAAYLLGGIQVAGVVALRELTHVSVKALLAHLVVHAVVAPLEHRPERFYRIRVGIPIDVLVMVLLYGDVLVGHAPVRPQVVMVDSAVGVRILVDEAVLGFNVEALDDLNTDFVARAVFQSDASRLAGAQTAPADADQYQKLMSRPSVIAARISKRLSKFRDIV